MLTSRSATKAIIGTPLALLALAVFAYPKLAFSTSIDQVEVAAPTKIGLKFPETLMTQFSGANLVMTEMLGTLGHNLMKVGAKVSAGDDAKTMVITPARPLTTGTYKVEWRAASSDTRPMAGDFTFKVK